MECHKVAMFVSPVKPLIVDSGLIFQERVDEERRRQRRNQPPNEKSVECQIYYSV